MVKHRWLRAYVTGYWRSPVHSHVFHYWQTSRIRFYHSRRAFIRLLLCVWLRQLEFIFVSAKIDPNTHKRIYFVLYFDSETRPLTSHVIRHSFNVNFECKVVFVLLFFVSSSLVLLNHTSFGCSFPKHTHTRSLPSDRKNGSATGTWV